jgi:predicted AlkP superfamily phosphohydrolase/phosphomutase
MPPARTRVLVIGLDCAAPQLVFERWRYLLHHLTALRQAGVWGKLRSTVPPITVPAWTCMMTSRDPGEHGMYGFRNRAAYDYESLIIKNSTHVAFPTLWNYLSRARKTSVVLGVPQSYPPKPLNGILAGCFMTPSKKDGAWTYPPEIGAEMDRIAGGDYVIDVKDFRTDDKDRLLEELYTMTRRRFAVVREFLKTKPWDLFMFVEMGVDRIHHGFWRYADPAHRLYEPGHKYENAIRDYYVAVDQEIGKILDDLPPDVHVLVVSDHGARTMVGGIAINEWLRREGELTLRAEPAKPTSLKMENIDWTKTRAWGEGGYYGRVFLNVRDREPQGVIPPEDYERVRSELADRIAKIPDEKGRPIGTRVFKPEEVYRAVNGVAPDLIVYFGDLSWRSAGKVGGGAVHLFENDTGPDDANHDPDGLFILTGPQVPVEARGRELKDVSLYDVLPTLLTLYGLPVPEGLVGRALSMS